MVLGMPFSWALNFKGSFSAVIGCNLFGTPFNKKRPRGFRLRLPFEPLIFSHLPIKLNLGLLYFRPERRHVFGELCKFISDFSLLLLGYKKWAYFSDEGFSLPAPSGPTINLPPSFRGFSVSPVRSKPGYPSDSLDGLFVDHGNLNLKIKCRLGSFCLFAWGLPNNANASLPIKKTCQPYQFIPRSVEHVRNLNLSLAGIGGIS